VEHPAVILRIATFSACPIPGCDGRRITLASGSRTGSSIAGHAIALSPLTTAPAWTRAPAVLLLAHRSNPVTVTTRGFVFPVVGNIEAAVYIDRQPGCSSCSAWRLTEGATTTHGIDRGPVRLRLVLDRLIGGRRPVEGWGMV
jgi:hypothetical protein